MMMMDAKITMTMITISESVGFPPAFGHPPVLSGCRSGVGMFRMLLSKISVWPPPFRILIG